MTSRIPLVTLCVLFALVICDCKSTSTAEEETETYTAQEIVVQMGSGINIGNTFDLNSRDTSPANFKRTLDAYKQMGLTNIRIPVTWMDGYGGDHLADENGNVNFDHPRFLELEQNINYAIEQGFYVTINAHHEHWLFDSYDGSSAINTVFTTLWTDIANHFKEYPQQLIFEVLNEPQGNFGEWGGEVAPGDPTGIALTRQINEVGYNAIRVTGGDNETRIIQVGVNGMGNHSQLDDVYPTPNLLPGGGTDAYLMIQVHTYDPWSFCGQDGSNSEYPGEATVINSIKSVTAHANTLGVPLNYGEWGVGRNARPQERNTDLVRNHYKSLNAIIIAEGAASTVWEDGGWFGLIEIVGGNVAYTHNILPFMMRD